MTLKARLTAMMVLLLMAVIVLQYLLAERERRALVERLSELSSRVDQSTRAIAERSHLLSLTEPRPDIRSLLEQIEGDSLVADVGENTTVQVVVFQTDSLFAGIDDLSFDEEFALTDTNTVQGGFVEIEAVATESTRVVTKRWRHGNVRHASAPRLRRPFPGEWVTADTLDHNTNVVVNLPLPGSVGDSMYAVRLRYPFAELTAELDQARTRSLAWLGTLLGVGVAGAFLLSSQLTRPIHRLQRSFRRVQQGDLDVVLEPERSDEIGHLTTSFNEMVARLKETREMETRLAESEHLASLGRLAAGVAHEVRNPLNAILLSMQQMRDRVTTGGGEGEDFERYYAMVTSEIARLERLVSTFLDLSRVGEIAVERMDIADSLRASVELWRPEAAARSVEIRSDIEDSLMLEGDPARLPNVWNNLLSNAVAATHASGTIHVRARRDAENVLVEVRDTGDGMRPDQLAHIWEPFYSGRKDGTGLGLSIVRALVEAHAGSVHVESSPGAGSVFRVLLPVVRPHSVPQENRVQEESA
ncbi:MAG: HAMP domain-containing histidine kinase [Candidatus Latescibacterota bacterium]|nr:MAG: HAMP domain-containing histidine kinase [Candidatus Latescibacterota bacterium]